MKKKIAFVVEKISNRAGIERAVINSVNGLIKTGKYDISIISIFTDNSDYPAYLLDKNVKLIHLRINKGSKYAWYIKFVKAIRKVIKNESIRYVIGTTHGINSCLGSVRKNSKVIGCEHFNYDSCSKIMRFSKYITYPKLDALVLLTIPDSKRYFYVGENKLYVIPNIVSFQTEDNAKFDAKRIIAVGRLSRQKGFDYLIQVAKKLKNEIPEWQIDILGDGDQREYLLNEIQKNNLNNFVNIKPATNNIMEELLKSSIYVMTSRFEGLPMALLEAMACGVPCISFDCPYGPAEIITPEEDGILVKNGNTDELADAICRLIEDTDKRIRMGKQAQKNIQRYSREEVMKLWDELFNTLTTARP